MLLLPTSPTIETGTFFAYRLVDLSHLIGAIDALPRVFDIPGGIAEVSAGGHIRVTQPLRAAALASGRSHVGSVVTAATAELRARAYLDDVRKRAAGCRELIQAQVCELVPTNLTARRIGAVYRPDPALTDILCDFAVSLQLDTNRTAGVEGAAVQLRLDSSGRVTSVYLRWRPISARLSSPAMTPMATTSASWSHAHTDGDTQAATPRFVLNDEHLPQTVLAPFLTVYEGHHGSELPMCRHAMTVQIQHRDAGAHRQVAVLVTGGSGDFETEWTLAAPLADGSVGPSMRRGEQVDLDVGIQAVSVTVTDRQLETVAAATTVLPALVNR